MLFRFGCTGAWVRTLLVGLAGWWGVSLHAVAQIQITLPTTRAVFQHDNANRASVFIAGNFTQLVDRVEARFVARQGGSTTGWTTIQENPSGGLFAGQLAASGGWYNLEVRGTYQGNQVGSVATLERVGIGEVFLIAGQSNAQGNTLNDGWTIPSGEPESTDDRVTCIDYINQSESLNDLPRPIYTKLTANSHYAPRGFGGWGWGALGDLLAARLNVPILFMNAAYGSTSVGNWLESARGQRTKNIFCLTCEEESYYPAGMPYGNLRLALNAYVPQTGVRAVLWHQGESDNLINTSAGDYASMLRSVIDISRGHSGKNIPWVIARASLVEANMTQQSVIDGQNATINPGANIFAGPYTDNIQNPRPSGTHFEGDGLRQFAQAWFDALVNSDFFSTSQAQASTPAPTVSVACNNANSLTFNLGTSYASYTWTDNQGAVQGTGNAQTGNSGATFWPKVKDGTGNIYFAQPVSVPATTLPAAPTLTAEGPTTVCIGASAKLVSSGRSDDLWSNGSLGRTITPNQPGAYTAKTKGVYGCYSESSASLTVQNFPPPPAAPTITANTATTICPEASITLTASNALKYEWSNGSTAKSITTSRAETFTVKAIDANGCSSVASQPLEVRLYVSPAAPVIAASGKTVFCEGGEVTLTSSQASSYVWNNGATTPSVSTRTSGSFSLTIKDANGCVSPASSVTQVKVNSLPTKPTITANGKTTFCDRETVVLTGSNPAALPAQFNWTSGNTGQSLTITKTSTFRVSVTDANGCTSRDSSDAVAIKVNPLPAPPAISAGGPTTFCPESSVLLTSTDGLGYQWSNGGTGKTLRVNQAGPYTARLSDANGCVSDPSNVISISLYPTPAAPVIAASGRTTFCDGGEVTLTSSSALSYVWNNGATTPSVSTRTSGSFSLTIKDANGCVSPTSSVTRVIVNPLPVKPTITPDGPTTVCDGTTVRLTASNPTALPATFQWNNGAGSRDVLVTKTGSFRLTVTDANGCTSRDSSDVVRVTVNPNPAQPRITASGPTTFCADKSVTFTATPDVAYRWSTGATTASITVNTTAQFSVQVINQYNCLSIASASVTTKVNALPAAPQLVAGGNTVFCDGDSVQLCSNSVLPTTWNLTNDATSCTWARKTGAYFATVTDANGCVSTASTKIAVDAKALPSTPTVERVGTYTLQATGTLAGDVYAWQLDGQTLPSNEQVIKAIAAGTYEARTQLEYQVLAPINSLVCYSKPSEPFELRFDATDTGLSVYPVPSTGRLTLETREDLVNAQVTVFALDGRVIFSDVVPLFNERKVLELQTAPGLYILRVQTPGFNQIRRVQINP